MSKTLQLSLIIFVITLATLGLAFQDELKNNLWTGLAFLLLSINAAYVVYSTKAVRNQVSEESSAGGVGVIGSVAVFSLILSGLAVISALNDWRTGTIILCFGAVAVLLGGQYLIRFSQDHLNVIATAKGYSSSHAKWESSLETLSALCKDQASRNLITSVREKCRYLARDGSDGAPENDKIYVMIEAIEASVLKSEYSEIASQCDQLANLLSARENSLRRQRSKI